MKVCILGATRNSGSRLVAQAIERGHEATAVARNTDDLATQFPEATIVGADFASIDSLAQAMQGHKVVINAAGHVGTPEIFVPLVDTVVDAARQALGTGGRLWLFAGAALLDVPGTDRMTIDLSGVPATYAPHLANFRKVLQSDLDWSVLCPGPMIDSPTGKPKEGLIVSTEAWPVPRPGFTRFPPWVATSLAFKNAIGRMTIYYEDAAKVILDDVGKNLLVGKRVGIALPEGRALDKPGYSTRPEPR